MEDIQKEKIKEIYSEETLRIIDEVKLEELFALKMYIRTRERLIKKRLKEISGFGKFKRVCNKCGKVMVNVADGLVEHNLKVHKQFCKGKKKLGDLTAVRFPTEKKESDKVE